MRSIAKQNKFELEADFATESLAKARSDFVGNLQEMRASAEPEFKQLYDDAISIAEDGTEEQMHRVAEILASDDPYPVMLEKLRALKLEQEGKRIGDELMKGYKSAIAAGSPAASALGASLATNVVPKTEKPPASMAVPPIDTSAQVQALGALNTAFNTASTAALTFRNNVVAAMSGVTTGLGAAASSAKCPSRQAAWRLLRPSGSRVRYTSRQPRQPAGSQPA